MFLEKQDILRDKIRKFIAGKYDIMVGKLQFADNMNETFRSVETIVNFICENMAEAKNDDLRILIPLSIKQKMKNALIVRDSKLKFKRF